MNLKIKFLLLSSLFLISILTFDLNSNPEYSIDESNNFIIEENKVRCSGHWSPDFIHIDNNWSLAASSLPWVHGSGSWSNPYRIENVTIDGSISPFDSGIFIQNTNEYFIIRNCTVYNKGYISSESAGIRLSFANNGTIIQNNCSNNWGGINLGSYCDNNTIIQNNANDNSGTGIRVYNSDDNIITKNTANENSNYGIMIGGNSKNNQIIDNTCCYNEGSYGYGILLSEGHNNNITKNQLDYNEEGLTLKDGTYQCIVWENIIRNNENYGVHIFNESAAQCHDNLLYNNRFENPLGINAYDNGSNNQWDNNKTGNFWHDYDGKDKNDDGIGDTAYNKIGGTSNAVDEFPIWEDGCDVDCDEDEDDEDIIINPIALLIVLGTFIGIICLVCILKLKKK